MVLTIVVVRYFGRAARSSFSIKLITSSIFLSFPMRPDVANRCHLSGLRAS